MIGVGGGCILDSIFSALHLGLDTGVPYGEGNYVAIIDETILKYFSTLLLESCHVLTNSLSNSGSGSFLARMGLGQPPSNTAISPF